jgi:hypothetical protein
MRDSDTSCVVNKGLGLMALSIGAALLSDFEQLRQIAWPHT